MTNFINAYSHARFNPFAGQAGPKANFGNGGYQPIQSKRFKGCCCHGPQRPVHHQHVSQHNHINNTYNITINVNVQVAQIISSLHNLISNFLAQHGYQGALPHNPGGFGGGYQPGPIGYGGFPGGYQPGPIGHGGFLVAINQLPVDTVMCHQ